MFWQRALQLACWHLLELLAVTESRYDLHVF